MLRNRIYTGDFDFGGKRYRGTHEPLVSKAVWQRCQEILDGHRQSRHRHVKHDFAFSGVIRCGHCGCSIVGEVKKEKYVYYHCTGYRGKCPERYAREEALIQRFAERLRELVIAPEIITWLHHELSGNDLKTRAEQELSVTSDNIVVVEWCWLRRQIACTEI